MLNFSFKFESGKNPSLSDKKGIHNSSTSEELESIPIQETKKISFEKVGSSISLRMEKSVFLILSLAALVIGMYVDNLDLANGITPVGDWKFAQFVLSFQEWGFLKRGAVGSLMKGFHVPATNLSVFAVSCLILPGFIYCCMSYVFSKKEQLSKDFYFFCLLILLSPAVFLQAGYDLGRYDYINYVIFFLSLHFARRGNMIICGLLSSLAILFIHETYIFLWLPVIICYFIAHDKNLWFRVLCFIVIPSFIALMVVIGFGGLDDQAIVAIYNRYPVLGMGNTPSSPLYVWKSTLIQNLKFTLHHWWSAKQVIRFFIGTTYPIFVFVYLRKIYKANSLAIDLFLLSPFFCIPLFFVGIDFYRWMAILSFNLIIVGIERLDMHQKATAHPLNIPHSKKLYLVLIFFFLTGPLGIDCPFPLLF